MNPIQILNNAQKQVPSLKFATGLVGVAAAAVLIKVLIGQTSNAYVLIGSVFIGMAILFVFSVAVQKGVIGSAYAAAAVIWSIILFFIVFLVFTISAFASGIPCNWAKFIGVDASSSCGMVIIERDRRPIREDSSQEIGAFTYNDVNAGVSSPRIWKRLAPGRWVERYPNGSETYFNRVGRINYSGCDGVVLFKIGDEDFQVLIPDKDCPNKELKFRRATSGPWIGLSQLLDVS